MNERIKELKRQAWDSVQHDLETVERDHAVMEQEQQAMVDAKFAELIVQECISLCDQVDLVGADDCIYFIKEHFGVER